MFIPGEACIFKGGAKSRKDRAKCTFNTTSFFSLDGIQYLSASNR